MTISIYYIYVFHQNPYTAFHIQIISSVSYTPSYPLTMDSGKAVNQLPAKLPRYSQRRLEPRRTFTVPHSGSTKAEEEDICFEPSIRRCNSLRRTPLPNLGTDEMEGIDLSSDEEEQPEDPVIIDRKEWIAVDGEEVDEFMASND